MSSLTRPLALLRFSNSPISQSCRAFSTTLPNLRLSTDKELARIHANIPPYPYPAARWYKQSNYGLYAGRRLRFGNTVSEKNEIKNRRKWHPNVRYKRVYSSALNRFIRIKVVTRVLRTIDKCGGLDNYLLGEKTSRIKELGMGGWALRWRVMRTPAVREKMAREREALGLTGKAPWEIKGWEEAVEEGWDMQFLGMNETDAQATEEGIDEALDQAEALEEEDEASYVAIGEQPEQVKDTVGTAATIEEMRPSVGTKGKNIS